MTTLFTYVMPYDSGAAPNPFWGVCTLVICKPKIRLTAKVGDWIVGMGAKQARVTDRVMTDMTGHMVYAMRVTSKMTMAEYNVYAQEKLPKKLPKWIDRDWRRRVGDCLYDFSTDPPTQRKGVHGPLDAIRDIRGEHALLSTDFVYFGDQAIRIPKSLAPVVPSTQGQRSRSNQPYLDQFVQWFRGLGYTPGSVLGEPIFRKFIGRAEHRDMEGSHRAKGAAELMTEPDQDPRWHDLIRTMLPQPIRTVEGLLIGGDPGEVVVRISDDKLEVAAYAIVWDSQQPRLAPEGWKSFPVTAKPERVAKAIIKARARRIGTYEWCPRCRSVQPPEWMSDGICQGCAEKAGAVF